ncbi:hypothetical protein [Chitinophaga sp. HK235]|uniref:hypothetical protein n=1 Tax=Chitinophaga sp. HK235 TaxID=2952571 RepID=UPI001BA66A58|nr:hypothetical protein [Chitinophaga sp. HK235]
MKMTALRYLPILGMGILFSVSSAAQQLKLGLQPTQIRKDALLELNSDSQGLLLNRVPKSAITAGGALYNAADGMFVYVTDAGEKCLYIKAAGAWKKVADFSGITTDNIPEGTTNLYFTNARARAAFSAGTGININAAGAISNTGVLTFASRTPDATGNIAPLAADYASFYLPWACTISLQAGTGMKSTTTATKNLNTNPTFTIDADKDAAIWNANKLASVAISATAPTANQVLTFNGTQWEPKAPASGGTGFIINGTTPQTADFNITGYADVGTAVRVGGNITAGGGVTAATGTFSSTVSVANGLSLTNLTTGSVPFIGASGLVTQFNGQFFWDNTKTALGLGTNVPKNKLEITGQAAGLGETVFTSGLRLSNLAAVAPGAANTKMLSINTNGDVIVTVNPLSTRKIKLVAGSGVIDFGATGEQDLSADRTWTIKVDSSKNIWNANKIQNNAVATTAPNDGDVLKWNTATQLYTPAPDITGGASYGTLTSTDIRNADAPDARYRMKIWQGLDPSAAGAGTVTNGPLGTSAWAWSVLAFKSGNYTTQLYFDKNTLALREWQGGQAPLAANAGNPWYKVVTTHGDNTIPVGAIPFGYRTSDASTEISQDANNLFWDNTNKELGIGTNSPAANLDVNGTFKMGQSGTPLNGMYKFQGTYTGGNTTINKQQQLIFTINVTAGIPALNADASVIVTPASDISTGTTALVSIGWARVNNSTSIKVCLINANTGTNYTFNNNTKFNITIIQ